MKKVLLTVAAAFAGMAMFATDLTHQDSVAIFWKAKTLATKKPTLVVFDYSDTTFAHGLNFKNFWTQHSEGTKTDPLDGVYKVDWDKTEKALVINFDYSKQTGDNYSAVLNYTWVDKIMNSTSFNPFLGKDSSTKDSVKGIMLDMSKNKDAGRKLVINCKVVGVSDKAQIRFDLSDANGRQSNQISPKHTILPSSDYQDITFDWGVDANGNDNWNQDVTELTDGWSSAWLDVDNGRSVGVVGKLINGLPGIGAGGADLIKLDTSCIVKWNIQFNDGSIAAAAADKTFKLYVKTIKIGDQLASEANTHTFGGPNGSVASKIVKAAKKITPNVGSKFAFEGKGTMVNILGQVVATGTNSIDASSVAGGVYYIIIDGVASKVIVK